MIRHLSAAAAVLGAAPALAGGFAAPIPTPAPVMPAPVMPAPALIAPSDWTGGYVGLQFGSVDVSTEPQVDPASEFEPFSYEGSGSLYGVHAGYMADFGRLVLGAELDYDKADVDLASTDVRAISTFGTLTSIARAKVRLGFDAGRLLPYVTAGVAQATVDPNDDLGVIVLDDTARGRFVGLGVAFRVSDRFSLGVEALRHEFEDFPSVQTEGGPIVYDTDVDTLTLRASYHF